MFLKKLKIEQRSDPANTVLGIYPKETKTLLQKDRRDWFKMAEQKYVLSLSLVRTPESQLTAEQSLTGRNWNSPKKIPHIQRQRRSHNEMVGAAQSQ